MVGVFLFTPPWPPWRHVNTLHTSFFCFDFFFTKIARTIQAQWLSVTPLIPSIICRLSFSQCEPESRVFLGFSGFLPHKKKSTQNASFLERALFFHRHRFRPLKFWASQQFKRASFLDNGGDMNCGRAEKKKNERECSACRLKESSEMTEKKNPANMKVPVVLRIPTCERIAAYWRGNIVGNDSNNERKKLRKARLAHPAAKK